MNRICLLIVFILAVAGAPTAKSQPIRWSETRFSVSGQWVIPQKEFGTFWKNGPALGVMADIPLQSPLSFTASAVVSWHSPADSPRKAKIPHVALIQLAGGLAFTEAISDDLSATLSTVIVNNTFILSGPPVRPGFENAVESEFGISFGACITVRPATFAPVSLLASYQPIFVGLDPVAIFSFGIAMGLD